ncbi:orotate phosphoribosyltransferase [Candidatus Fermentibacteria bacterium]|nr:orotate phosphoribosyltransferase [Candidatus Fermentibacteria bacterium]
MTQSKADFLDFLVQQGALRFGEFTLKSGGRSPFFVDLGQICTGDSLWRLGEFLADAVVNNYGAVDVLYGPPYKAIPMIAAAAIALRQRTGKDVGVCYSRKEAKEHGERGTLVGMLPGPEARILVVDDVFTTGATKLEALETLEEAGGVRATGILVSVDRRTQGQDAGIGDIPLTALVHLGDIVDYMEQVGDSRAHLVRGFWENQYGP